MLVNTVGTTLNLSQGAVSKSLLEKAGSEMQKECTQRCPNGIAYGEVLETSGHNLNCKQVYHVAAMDWGKDDTESVSISLVHNFGVESS